jgi:hypothetical protein
VAAVSSLPLKSSGIRQGKIIKAVFYIELIRTGHIVTCRWASFTQVSLTCAYLYILILHYDGQVYKFHTILNLYEHVNNRQAIKPQRPVAVLTQNNIISCSTQYLIINLTIFFMSPIEIFAVYINKMMSF